MTEPPRRPLDAWQTDAPGPFVTICAGGPLEGIVTLTAIEGGHGRTLIEARWTQDGGMQSDSLEVDSYEQARMVAYTRPPRWRPVTRPTSHATGQPDLRLLPWLVMSAEQPHPADEGTKPAPQPEDRHGGVLRTRTSAVPVRSCGRALLSDRCGWFSGWRWADSRVPRRPCGLTGVASVARRFPRTFGVTDRWHVQRGRPGLAVGLLASVRGVDRASLASDEAVR